LIDIDDTTKSCFLPVTSSLFADYFYLNEASSINKQIIALMWISGHIGIKGDEIADLHAKDATNNIDLNIIQKVTYDDIKTRHKETTNKWLNSQHMERTIH